MFYTNANDIVRYVVKTNEMYIENKCNYLRCFYQFGQEEIGAILIKQNGVIHGYKTRMVPSGEITTAIIDYCKDRVDDIC